MKPIHAKLLICTAVVASTVLGFLWFQSLYIRSQDIAEPPTATQKESVSELESSSPYPAFDSGEVVTITGTYACYSPDAIAVKKEECLEGFVTDEGEQYLLDWSGYSRHGWKAESGTRAKLTGRTLPGAFSGYFKNLISVDLIEPAD